jgi:hypothetical protein
MSITLEENALPNDYKVCEVCGVVREKGQYFFSQQPRKPVLEGTVRAKVCQYINKDIHDPNKCLFASSSTLQTVTEEPLENYDFKYGQLSAEAYLQMVRDLSLPPAAYT